MPINEAYQESDRTLRVEPANLYSRPLDHPLKSIGVSPPTKSLSENINISTYKQSYKYFYYNIMENYTDLTYIISRTLYSTETNF